MQSPLILSFLLNFVGLIPAIWVYIDAKKLKSHEWRRVSVRPALWAIANILFFYVALPAYLIIRHQRNKPPGEKTHLLLDPGEKTSWRAFKATVSVIAVIVIGPLVFQTLGFSRSLELVLLLLLFMIFIMLLPFIFYYAMSKRKIYRWKNLLLRQKFGFVLFSLIAIGLPTLNSIFWFFDIGGYASGSSTSAIVFVWIPIWVFVFSIVPLLLMRDPAEGDREGSSNDVSNSSQSSTNLNQ